MVVGYWETGMNLEGRKLQWIVWVEGGIDTGWIEVLNRGIYRFEAAKYCKR